MALPIGDLSRKPNINEKLEANGGHTFEFKTPQRACLTDVDNIISQSKSAVTAPNVFSSKLDATLIEVTHKLPNTLRSPAPISKQDGMADLHQ